MEINLGVGVGDLLFGITQHQAATILGSTGDKLFKTELGCQRIQYDEVMMELSFEPENQNRLGWIEMHHPESTVFGYQLIGSQRQLALDTLTKHLGRPSEMEDYGPFDMAFYEDQWLELIFEFGKLRSYNFGVLYDENDEPLWPK